MSSQVFLAAARKAQAVKAAAEKERIQPGPGRVFAVDSAGNALRFDLETETFGLLGIAETQEPEKLGAVLRKMAQEIVNHSASLQDAENNPVYADIMRRLWELTHVPVQQKCVMDVCLWCFGSGKSERLGKPCFWCEGKGHK